MQVPNLDTQGFLEKYFKYVIFAAIGVVAFKFWGSIVPFVLKTLEDTVMTGIYLAGITAVSGFLWYKSAFVISTYKNICNYIEDFFVNKDPLSYMDRYVEYLTKKMQNLNSTIVVLSGKRTKLQRRLEDLQKKVEENKRLGNAAKKIGDSKAASLYGIKIQRDVESIELFTPMYDRANKYLKFMSDLYENWKYSQEGLVYQIQSKREEFELIKETVKGLKSAEELIGSNSAEAQLYGKSVKALEERATQNIAYIEDFEKRSKDIINGITIEKQAAMDEGLKALEEYMGDSKVFLPNFNVQDVEYEEVPVKRNFNLLK